MRCTRTFVQRSLPRTAGLVAALLLACCGGQPRALEDAYEARPAPTWFAWGHDAYRLSEAREQHGDVLGFVDEPRWFEGAPPTPEPPDRLGDVPREDRGARLELGVDDSDPESLLLTLTLAASPKRPLWREHEHRRTNVLPFLLGFYADGEPPLHPYRGSAAMGGIRSFVELVPRGETRRWTLRVRRDSLRARFSSAPPTHLEIVAVFGERQHSSFAVMPDGYATPLRDESAEPPPFQGAPIVIRSAVVPIRW